jgi:lipoic acid synthetase
MTHNVKKTGGAARYPAWLKKRLSGGPRADQVTELLRNLGLVTVCCGARCPNQAECFSRGTATFLILGETCTRSCRFCAIPSGSPQPPREDEPHAVAEACAQLNLRHVVITSVTRDDLPDGGAAHFARTIQAVRSRLPDARVEVLTPDFQGSIAAIDVVLDAAPDVFNHNVETVPRLYPEARPQGDYRRSLEVLARAGARARADDGTPITKSGLMVGLGETSEEVRSVMRDLLDVGCEMLTIGQYLAPSGDHIPIDRFVEPAEFDAWAAQARDMGFSAVAAGPFVRSSYLAESLFEKGLGKGDKSTP